MSLPVGIGLAGYGRWGRNYVKTLLGLPECRLAAVADPDPTAQAAVAALTGIAARKSLDELLADPAIQAIVLATPDRTHCVLAAAALAAGRDVLIEKPMSLDPLEADSLVERAEVGRLVLAVGHTAVYETGFARLAGEIQANALDTGRRATAVRTSSGYADGRSSPIIDLCPHDLAMAVLLFGAPSEVRARSDGTGVEYAVRFASGAALDGRVEWREPPHVRRFELAGFEHRLNGRSETPGCRDVRDTPLGRQCLDFIRSCRSRRQPLSSGRLGLTVVRCLNALAASARDSGDWISLRTEVQEPNDKRRAGASGLRCSDLGVRA